MKRFSSTFALLLGVLPGSSHGVSSNSNADQVRIVLNNDRASRGDSVWETKWSGPHAEQRERCLVDAFEGDVQHNNGRAPTNGTLAEYSFDPPKDGCYAIEEWHPTAGCARLIPEIAVPLRIDFWKGETAMGLVDQRRKGGRWNYLTKLPFYAGTKGNISVTREGFPLALCPEHNCLYMADAFRLTWISKPPCMYQSATTRQSVREQLEREQEELWRAHAEHRFNEMKKRADEARAKEERAKKAMGRSKAKGGRFQTAMGKAVDKVKEEKKEEIAMAMRIVVDDFEIPKEHKGKMVRFPFQAPADGCYVVEEMHPHRPEEQQEPVPYQVNYCKGLSASAAVHHADGRHRQWNYVAHLPFYNDESEKAGVLVPRRVLFEEQNQHAFRYTYVGSKCSAEEAQVQRMELRTTADFNSVKDRLPEFKERLRELLAEHAKVAMERIQVSRVRAGSVISEVTVLPAAVHAAGIYPSSGQSAVAAVLAIEKALEEGAAGGLGKEICALADPTGGAAQTSSCTTQVSAKGPAPTLLIEPVDSNDAQDITEEERGRDWKSMVVEAGAAAFFCGTLLGGALILVRRLRKRKNNREESTTTEKMPEAEMTTEKEMETTSPSVVVAPVKGKSEEGTIPDDTSTITPKEEDLEKSSNISPIEQV